MSGARLLIADDNPEFRNLVQDAILLAEPSWVVEVAGDGREALEMICKGRYDVAVLDIRMPHLDGLEVLREAREEGIRTAILVLTGYGDEHLSFQAGKLGAERFLDKPITPLGLLAEIREALHSRVPPHVMADRLDAFLKAHCFNPGLMMDNLCSRCGVSERYASRLFREHLGDSFEGRRAYHRVQMAKRLLESTREEVKVIAGQCGFRNQHRLTEAFKRLERMSPSQCRQICADERTDGG